MQVAAGLLQPLSSVWLWLSVPSAASHTARTHARTLPTRACNTHVHPRTHMRSHGSHTLTHTRSYSLVHMHTHTHPCSVVLHFGARSPLCSACSSFPRIVFSEQLPFNDRHYFRLNNMKLHFNLQK